MPTRSSVSRFSSWGPTEWKKTSLLLLYHTKTFVAENAIFTMFSSVLNGGLSTFPFCCFSRLLPICRYSTLTSSSSMVGMWSAGPLFSSLFCCCSMQHMQQPSMLKVGRYFQVFHYKRDPSFILAAEVGHKLCFSHPNQRKVISDIMPSFTYLASLWKWKVRGGYRLLPACPLLSVTWRWSPVDRQALQVNLCGRREGGDTVY